MHENEKTFDEYLDGYPSDGEAADKGWGKPYVITVTKRAWITPLTRRQLIERAGQDSNSLSLEPKIEPEVQ